MAVATEYGTATVRHGSARAVAVIADVHGNVPALAAVIDEIKRAGVDLVVSCGDLTWGSLPEGTVQLARALSSEVECLFIRGNAERALLEMAAGDLADRSERELWMLDRHGDAELEFIRGFVPSAVVAVEGLGSIRFCHGSPAHDEDCITPIMPDDRLRPMVGSIEERIVASAHIHVQFDRDLGWIRSLNPGSVGLPYEGRQGAFWATLGPRVELRSTAYDVSETCRRYQLTDDPSADRMAEALLAPTAREEAIAYAEQVQRSG